MMLFNPMLFEHPSCLVPVGEGNYGKVVRGRYKGNDVAIKFQSNSEAKNEASMLKRVQGQEGCLDFIGEFEMTVREQVFGVIVTPLARGDLEHVSTTVGPMRLVTALETGIQIAKGLENMVRVGVVGGTFILLGFKEKFVRFDKYR
jgi:hypothetical protein